MKRIISIVIIIVTTLITTHAQPGKMAAVTGKVSNGYDFWLYAPQAYFDQPNEKFPVVIYLHGARLCGRGLRSFHKYLTLDAIAKGRDIETMVIAPQNPGGGWKPERLNNVLEWVVNNYNVDTTRIYVVGMSLGGYGAMDFVGTYPHKMQGLGTLPFWIIHGTADRAVTVGQSKKVVNALKEQGNDKLLRYDWLPGANHGQLARIYYLEQTYQWLFSHTLNDNPRQVNRDIVINLNVMSNAYKGLNSKGTITKVSSLKNAKPIEPQDDDNSDNNEEEDY